jgi:anti-sigma B factor antagonist
MSNSWGPSAEVAVDAVVLVVELDDSNSVRLMGELDIAGVQQVSARLEEGNRDVELDCAGLTFIDASGLGLFLTAQAACHERGGELFIVSPSRCVVRLLELTGLENVLTVRHGTSAS